MRVDFSPKALDRFKSAGPVFLFLLLSCLFLWRTLAGEVFVPAGLLRHIAPWSASYSEQERPPWNPLMYDSVGQFYPWRKFAGDTIHSGYLPLWNPYQFCGTPFVGNSQSAVFYPGNALSAVLRPEYAAGWSVILHLTLAATFMWLFVRSLGAGSGGAVVSGIAFAFSTWEVSWLHLPTFLATSCWLPLILMLVMRLFRDGGWRTSAGLGFAAGMALLAGHLQIAFYVLSASALLVFWLAVGKALRGEWAAGGRGLALSAAGLALAVALASPQLLPTLELSRHSHRAGAATEAGYEAYQAYAVSELSAAAALFPDFFGNPSNPRSPYFGASKGEIPFNYAENAAYAGAGTLLLAILALLSGRNRHPLKWFLGLLVVVSLLLAVGSSLSRFLYFTIPGFASSGSPGRSLVLYAFAVSALGGLGFDWVLASNRSALRSTFAALVGFGLIGCIAYGISLGIVGRLGGDPATVRHYVLAQSAVICISALAVILLAGRQSLPGWMRALPVVILIADLFAVGINYNPTARAAEVYPVTAEIQALQARAGHERVMPVNERWIPLIRNPDAPGPNPALAPNGAMVFGLRDAQGYDSLFPGAYKAYLNKMLQLDSSPPEVGNMVLVKVANLALASAVGARYLVRSSRTGLSVQDLSQVQGAIARAKLSPSGDVQWIDDGPTRLTLEVNAPGNSTLRLADQYFPGWRATVDGSAVRIDKSDDVFRAVRLPGGKHRVAFEYRPGGFRLGLYLMGLALGIGVFALMAARTLRGVAYEIPAV